MLRIWITGAQGHTGSALSALLDTRKYQLILTDLDLDITNLHEVTQFTKLNRPDIIINCASLTDVEACEKNPDDAYRVNVIGIRNLALAANEIGAKIIHLSTDDVFSAPSSTPYNEFDMISPVSVYGKSKAAGERILTELTNRFVIVRSSWVYGIGQDFVDTVLDAAERGTPLTVPTNEFASPTSAEELAEVLIHFIDNDEEGLYHVVCPGACSRYEFAKTILEFAGKELELIPADEKDGYQPKYSVLDNMMLRLTGLSVPADWKTALKNYIDKGGR